MLHGLEVQSSSDQQLSVEPSQVRVYGPWENSGESKIPRNEAEIVMRTTKYNLICEFFITIMIRTTTSLISDYQREGEDSYQEDYFVEECDILRCVHHYNITTDQGDKKQVLWSLLKMKYRECSNRHQIFK
jgi:hypothetical protein